MAGALMAVKTKPKPKQPAPPRVISQSAQPATHSKGLAGPSLAPWTPFKPDLTPPAGFYDPALDANLGSVNRGLQDTTADAATAQSRLTSDLALGTDQINQTAGRSMEDIAAQRAGLTTSRDRSLADAETQRAQGTQDHTTALADLAQAFSRKANAQRQQMSAGGTLHGGAAIQAAEKRAANQAHDQAPLDTNFQRLVGSIDTGEARTNQDFATESGRLDVMGTRVGQDQQQALGQLGLGTQRQLDDLTTHLTRSQREAQAFGLDTSASKAAQASGAGWDPYAARPANQGGSGASAHKTVVKGGIAYTIDPKGRIISKRKAAG